MRCNFHKHVLSCPSGFAHVQIPKCSNHSGSIPCLLFLSATPGVLATPHLLSQTQRGASEARPLEDGSCRPRWQSSQTMNYSHRKSGKCTVCSPSFISISSYLACFLFSVMKQEIRIAIYETMVKLLFDGCGTLCRCQTLLFTLWLYTGHN